VKRPPPGTARRLENPNKLTVPKSRQPQLLFHQITAMAVDDIVADPALKLALETSKGTREQAINLLEQVSSTAQSTSPALDFQIQISKQQKVLLSHLAQLRGLYRDAQVGARETKAQTSEIRQEVDKLHLQLQNLYYEQRHLQGEIAACESYE
jgi:THO complex subunit 5